MDYADVRPSHTLCELYTDAMKSLGSVVTNTEDEITTASTDMGKS